MVDLIADSLTNTRVLAMVFAAIAAMATVLTFAMPLLGDRFARQAHEVGGDRARKDAPARARAAGARRKGVAAPVAEAVHAEDRRAVQSEQVARPGGGARAPGAGGIPRPGALCDVPVLPDGHADRRWCSAAAFYVFVVLKLDQPTSVKVGMCLAADLFRHQAAGDLHQEQDRQAPAIDQARVPGRARPAADLRRIRHVDRSRLQEGRGRDRLAVDSAWPRS